MGPVEPMYMPGRLRTGSRPSRTFIWEASYEAEGREEDRRDGGEDEDEDDVSGLYREREWGQRELEGNGRRELLKEEQYAKRSDSTTKEKRALRPNGGESERERIRVRDSTARVQQRGRERAKSVGSSGTR